MHRSVPFHSKNYKNFPQTVSGLWPFVRPPLPYIGHPPPKKEIPVYGPAGFISFLSLNLHDVYCKSESVGQT